jgi:hypothetical protein
MSRFSRSLFVLAPCASLGALGLIAQACGGSPPPGHDDPQPLCYFSAATPDSGMVRNLRANEWGSLVVRNYREGGQVTQDCAGNTIQYDRVDPRCEIHEDENEPAPQPVEVTEESVIVGRSDDGPMVRPIWVITHRFEDGDGFGPVVITQRRDLGVAVRAMGTLRLPTDRARLRLRVTGGQQILVADGERCPPAEGEEGEQAAPPAGGGGEEGEEEEEPTCLRASRLMPVVGNEILNPEVRTADGSSCIGPALVYTEREAVVGLENGWERVFRLAASMEYDGGAIIIHEQVVAEDRDPRDPGRPPVVFRTTDHDRYLFVTRGQMRSRGVPLFERAVRASGSLQLPIASARENRE